MLPSMHGSRPSTSRHLPTRIPVSQLVLLTADEPQFDGLFLDIASAYILAKPPQAALAISHLK
jgi:hypothetical protein